MRQRSDSKFCAVGSTLPVESALELFLFVCMVFISIFTSFQLYYGNQCTYWCFPGVFSPILCFVQLDLPAFSPFPTMFSTLLKTSFNFAVTFILSSANAFNLDKSKILSFGKELTTSWFPTCVNTMISEERGMNLVTMTIVNSQKRKWPSFGFKPGTH